MNLLEFVPSFRRQLRTYLREQDTDSTLAAYIADGVEALAWRWARDYQITTIQPNTYMVNPDIALKDKRAIMLMAGLLYKNGNMSLISFRDGDFAYDPIQGRTNPLAHDIAELDKILPPTTKLVRGFTTPIRGYANIYNPESYNWFLMPIRPY